MTTFEYKVLDVPYKSSWWGIKINHQELADKLNEVGKDGWELASAINANAWRSWYTGIVVILKRQTIK